MAVSRVIEVSFGRSSVALVRIDTAYFYNNGIIFKPTDIDLPASYQVHWADSPQASSTLETIGTAEGAPIPDDLWNRSRVIYGWIYLHPTEDSGVTGYEVRIYKNVRAGLPDGTEPTPEEQSVIDQTISALNTAVAKTAQDKANADASAQSASASASSAAASASEAATSAQASARSAESASESARVATEKATASAQSASQSAQIKSDIEGMVDDAQSYAESALIASQASVTARDTAQGYANSASASAQSASTSASNASASANTSSTKASEASTSAQTASQKATEASQSASQALSYKTDAESAKTASQTAQGLAESARDTAVSAKTDAESARDDAETARDEAQQAVASISDALMDKAPVITDTASGSIASFSDGADDLPLKSLVVDINPIQDLHGQDAPYPAGGGKNRLETTLNQTTESGVTYTPNADGTILLSGSVNGSYSQVVVGTISLDAGTYYIYSGIAITNVEFYISGVSGASAKSVAYNQFTIDTAVTNKNVYLYIPSGASVNNVTIKPMICLSSASNPTTYAPYENLCPISGWTEIDINHSDADITNPTTVTINLGQTVYGGKLDVLSGELVIDRAMIASYNGETLPSTWISDRDAYTQGATPTTGAQVVYKLATPIEIQLSANQINSLYGVNNLWADSGSTEVEYRADTKLFIERLTAPDSVDMVADANITSGKYFMVGNSLYKATANIANGSTIVVGTNCIRKSLSEALNEINA